jgi:hypothetical protein
MVHMYLGLVLTITMTNTIWCYKNYTLESYYNEASIGNIFILTSSCIMIKLIVKVESRKN